MHLWNLWWLLIIGHCWNLFKIAVLVDASILNTILGVPSECMHQSSVWPCKLSFSCWLQGGRHAKGCGSNKWLFSCCIGGTGSGNFNANIAASNIAAGPAAMPYGALYGDVNPAPMANLVGNAINEYKRLTASGFGGGGVSGGGGGVLPKRVMLKRRNENDVFAKPECGLPRATQRTLQKRIIGGRTANFAEYPWQAHIRIAEFQCGGVLVSQNIVATAAHCIQQARLQDISVYLGELDTQNLGHIHEPLPVEKHNVIQKIVHPRFQLRMTQPDRFDVALLKLAKPTGFSEHILPICLPLFPITLIGRKGLIAGWGKTEASMGHAGTNMLQVATVPIITSFDCVRWHESKRINVELYGEMFCAGHSDGHQDACLGDSGGPLIVKERGHFILVGITSAGFGCGVDHQPGIYHNIQTTAKWIQEMIVRHAPTNAFQ
ncbi:serine proteinase stubble [Anastrepha obliqua]|uniref:serine proteinase stubble n=1 Tax=Anastrepha obliqua TaxID=95512 RepID=UPI00240A6122|nr:serine proteinase stubble [Anastrepha obliqua]